MEITWLNGGLTTSIRPSSSAKTIQGYSSGRYYWEIVLNSLDAGLHSGIAVGVINNNNTSSVAKNCYSLHLPVGTVIGLAMDLSNYTLSVYINNVFSQTLTIPSTNNDTWYPFVQDTINESTYSCSITGNFSRKSLKYRPPNGYLPYERFYLFLLEQSGEIYSVNSLGYTKIGQLPITDDMFITYGADDLNILTVLQSDSTTVIDKIKQINNGKFNVFLKEF